MGRGAGPPSEMGITIAIAIASEARRGEARRSAESVLAAVRHVEEAIVILVVLVDGRHECSYTTELCGVRHRASAGKAALRVE